MTTSPSPGSTSAGARETVLQVRNASVTFDMERGQSRVLDDATIDILEREILGVVGESGSGKSMFASALLDAVVNPGILSGEIIYHPDGGDPVDITELSDERLKAMRWEEISMVFQGAMSSWNPTMTIRGHFKETLKEHGFDVEDGLDHARDLLSDLYLEPERVLDAYPHELSGGMKQRALIALSLVLEPNVLVMDEPTAALDLLMQRSILSLLEDLQGTYDLTIVFITHDLPLVAGLADRLAVMYAFEFVELAPADEVLGNPSHPYTRALLNAVPNLDTPLAEMETIEGAAPDPVNVPRGCSYHPRCPLADEQCEAEDPAMREIEAGDDHTAACHYPERAVEEIPLATTDPGTTDRTPRTGEQSADPVVALEDVEVHFETESGGLLDLFGDPDIVRAVDGVDLDVYENDVVALVGESGCGKTTLGKTAIGIERPTEGTVAYRGQDIWAAKDGQAPDIPFEEIRRSLQIIHQDPGSSLNPNSRVAKSLERPLARWQPDLDRDDRRARITSLLEEVGMTPAEDYAERYPHQLSGGEKQRVALVRALLMNPDLILADEAVSALDVSLRVEMMDLMLDLQGLFDTSYLFISHNLSNARYFAGSVGGRIGVMYLGELVEIGPAESVVNDPKHPYTKVLRWSTASLETDQEVDDPPIRGIDIPDPVDPPEGCRFHTRCPEAREVCRERNPELTAEDGSDHAAACFREFDEHPYWESDSIVDASESGRLGSSDAAAADGDSGGDVGAESD